MILGTLIINRIRLFFASKLSDLVEWVLPSEMVGEWGNGCNNLAEWVLYEEDIYSITYSCFDDLLSMISDKTIRIELVDEDCMENCCYIGEIGKLRYDDRSGLL